MKGSAEILVAEAVMCADDDDKPGQLIHVKAVKLTRSGDGVLHSFTSKVSRVSRGVAEVARRDLEKEGYKNPRGVAAVLYFL